MKKNPHFNIMVNHFSTSQNSNNSDRGNTNESFDSSFQNSQKGKGHTSNFNFQKKRNFSQLNSQDQTFYSQISDFKLQQMLDDQLILQQRVQKRDIIFWSKCLKQSFVKYFTDVIFSFLKNPSDLSFSLALERLKYYTQQTPFKQYQKQSSFFKNYENILLENQNEIPLWKTFPNHSQINKEQIQQKQFKVFTKQSSSEQNLLNKQNTKNNLLTIEQILREMFYKKKYMHMIYTFDILICHLTFLSVMLYYWSLLDQSNKGPVTEKSSFSRNNKQKILYSILQNKKSQKSMFQVLSIYIQARSQSININQTNILIVFFFLNYLRNYKAFQDQKYLQKILKLEENLMNNLKLYRRIKKMQRQFSHTSNQVVFQSQLHKYEHQHKLINNIEKTIFYIQLLNTHNFVSSPFQKHYQMFEYENARKFYHQKKDYFCIWVLNIIMRVCQKKNSQSLSKAAYYVIAFMAILKKFKNTCNFEGISLLLPVIFNLRQFLPKVWNYAISRRSQITSRLDQYYQLLNQKNYKISDIPRTTNAIIDEQVIYEMSERFKNFTKGESKDYLVDLIKHEKFYLQFVSDIVYHKSKIKKEYWDEIENYKKEREIGVSFNIYLLDTYLWKTFKGSNSKNMWANIAQRAAALDNQMKQSFYVDFIDYCFIGSSLKYKQLDI